MNLYSEEFLKDARIPVRKNIYVYIWRSGRIVEFLAEFRLYDHEIRNMDDTRLKSSTTVNILKNLSEPSNTRLAKSFTVSTESGEVNNNKIWLPERDFDKAKQLFIKDREARITEYKDRIKLLQKDIELLSSIENQ